MKKILLLSFLTLCSQFVFANGYQVLLQGNKETAMGNAGVGLKPTASALFFNPGALGFLEKSELQFGGNAVFGRTNFVEQGGTQEYEARPFAGAGYLYFAYSKDSASRVKAGLGITTPFGSIVDWEDGWVGEDKIEYLFLANINVQPTIAYRINDKLSIGAGIGINFGSVHLERKVRDSRLFAGTGEIGDLKLEGKSDVDINFNVGVFYQPTKDFSLGVSYRSRADATVNGGTATWTNTNASNVALLTAQGANLPDQFSAEIPLPSVFTIGLGAYPTERLTMAFDVSLIGWDAYESLTFDFNNNFPQSANARNFQQSTVIHLGAEYMITDKLAGRAGFYYDETPVLSGYMTPETPDAPARGYTFGLGYEVSKKVSLDLTLLYLDKKERSNEIPNGVNTNGLNGTYKTNAFIPGFGLRYQW